jgi:hypothetical protein
VLAFAEGRNRQQFSRGNDALAAAAVYSNLKHDPLTPVASPNDARTGREMTSVTTRMRMPGTA